MGQKINPYGFRLGITTNWKSSWYAEKKNYKSLLHQDLAIRDHIRKHLRHAGIAGIEIERKGDRIRVVVNTARPGVVIGRKGAEVEALKVQIVKMTGVSDVRVDAFEIESPQTSAQVLSQSIADQLAGRVMFRKAMKRAMTEAMRMGALGVKIQCSGRLGGAEMARRETYRDGRVPLTTLRADIDYGFSTSFTKQGSLGVKVWIYKGEIVPEREQEQQRANAVQRMRRRAERRTSRDTRVASDAPKAADAETQEPPPQDDVVATPEQEVAAATPEATATPEPTATPEATATPEPEGGE